MPGPNRAPRGGYQKPKDLGKTISRLLGYLTRSKLPLMAVFGCLLISVFTNIGGSYMMRGIINDFIWSGCTDFAGLGRAILVLVGIYLHRLRGHLRPVRRYGPAGPAGRQPAAQGPVRQAAGPAAVLL